MICRSYTLLKHAEPSHEMLCNPLQEVLQRRHVGLVIIRACTETNQAAAKDKDRLVVPGSNQRRKYVMGLTVPKRANGVWFSGHTSRNCNDCTRSFQSPCQTAVWELSETLRAVINRSSPPLYGAPSPIREPNRASSPLRAPATEPISPHQGVLLKGWGGDATS